MQITNINLTDIRVNTNNIYKEDNILELADSIQQYGQLENATVYFDDSIGDGKSYTLLGGHRRYLAITYLAERGMIEPFIKANIVVRPDSLCEEQMLIVTDNQQRVKDKDTKLREISYANDYWNYLVSIGKRPRLENGERKRDWIAKKTGYGSRVVQDILSEIRVTEQSQNTSTQPINATVSTNATRSRGYNSTDYKRNTKSALKKLQKLKIDFESDEIRNNLGADLSDYVLTNVEEMIHKMDEILDILNDNL